MATRSRPKAGTFRVDFTKEEGSGGSRFRVKEGDYRVKILGAKPTTSSEKGTPGLEVHFQIVEGKHDGKKFTDNLWNTPKALWRFRSLLEALGLDVPKRVVDIPIKKLKGKELGVTLTDDEFEGRTRSQVSDFLDLDTLSEADEEELEEDEDEVDEDEDEEEEEEDEEGADLDEMDRSELKAYIKENELDVKVKKSMDEDDIREAIQAAEGDEDEDDGEENLDDIDLDDDL